MREIAIQILIVILLISCSKKQDENTYHISEEPEYEVKSDLIFTSQDSLSKFGDFALIDSFLITIDEYTDTVMRIYKNLDFSNPVFSALKGNGPRDIVPAIELNKAVRYDSLVFEELNTHRIKKLRMNDNNNFSDFTSEFLYKKIPVLVELNITKNYILGLNVHTHKIFIYDKYQADGETMDYFLEHGNQYDDIRLANLYDCKLTANEEKQSICAAMFYINCVNFLNFQGKLQKTIIIEDKLYFPKPDPVSLGFPKEQKYFVGNYGTPDYVYCLYRDPDNFVRDVKIFVFNWEGEHITTIKTAGNIFRIAVDKNNEYILGLVTEADWSSTDIVKIPLEVVLKK
jgi:hypothetical protein